MKRLAIFIICNVFLILPTSNSFAHAFVTDSFPKSNETVTAIPARVWIEFDGNLATLDGHDLNKLLVYDASGKRIDAGDFQVGGARLSVGVKHQASGKIRMSFRVVSEDGHPVEGEIIFKSSFVSAETSAATPTKKNLIDSKSKTKLSAVVKPKSSSKPAIAKPKDFPKESESALKEHLGHLIEFIVAGTAIFIWSRIRQRRNL